MVRRKNCEFGEFLSVSKYMVCWSQPGEFSPVQYKKLFDEFYAADWFANELKKRYNWVICIEEKNLKRN